MGKILFVCPVCESKLEIQDEWLGMTATCPVCSNKIILAGDSAVSRASAAPSKRSPWKDYILEGEKTSLILAILGFVFCGIPGYWVFFPVLGIFLGIREKYATGIVANSIVLFLMTIDIILEINAS